jgi:hypothetical protein
VELSPTDGDRDSTRLSRAIALAKLGKYDQAVAVAEELAGRPKADSIVVYPAACVLSLASAAAGRDAGRAPAERQQLAERYAAAAVALLLRLQSQGYFQKTGNLAFMQEDKDLDPLRQRPDFQKLMAELGKKP